MLTNNFKQWMKTICSGYTRKFPQEGWPVVKGCNGNSYSLLGIFNENCSPFCFGSASPSLDYRETAILFGRGTEPFSRDDYKLNLITSGLNFTYSNFVGLKDDTGHPYIDKVIICTNTSDSPITISEVGFVCGLHVLDGESRILAYVLIDRTILSSPVTIGKDESCTIKYSMVNQFDV